jgi:hypothetical protein
MSIAKINGVIIIRDDFSVASGAQIQQISDHTVNTWQADRSSAEKKKNTEQGKIAEHFTGKYLREQLGLNYVDYDEFRSNNFEKHAPFDGLLSYTSIDGAVFKTINDEVSKHPYGQISDELRQALIKQKIFTVEIKSTKVIARHKAGGADDEKIIAAIKAQDDYLVYPRFCRKSSTISDLSGYIKFVEEKNGKGIATDSLSLRALELPGKNYFYVRVYIDFDTSKVYLIGFITIFDFFIDPHIKKMIQYGKSENAIYFSAKIANQNNELDSIKKILI